MHVYMENHLENCTVDVHVHLDEVPVLWGHTCPVRYQQRMGTGVRREVHLECQLVTIMELME